MTKPLRTSLKPSQRTLFMRSGRLLTTKKREKPPKTPPAVTYRGIFCQKKFTGKEPDPETGLYYYGARYLDPKTSRWISGDPALGEYLPVAPVNDEAKKRNGNLPGMGGVFNVVNMHVYHYAGNNPVKYVDPDGRDFDNQSENTYIVLPGDNDAQAVVVRPGEKYEGSIDGAFLAIEKDDGTYEADLNGPIYKVNDGSSIVMKTEGGKDRAYVVGLTSPLNNVIDAGKSAINKVTGGDKLPSGVYMPESDGHKDLIYKWEWGKRAENPRVDGAKEMGLSDKIYRMFTIPLFPEKLRERR